MKAVDTTELPELVGSEIGVSSWVEMPQERINAFAECTEDHQFIHVDEKAAKMTPFGGTVAHGFLTLSMLSKMAMEVGLVLNGIQMGVNYGFDRVRLVAPVPSGGRIRGHFVLKHAEERRPGQWQLTYDVTVEIEGGEKPALNCEWLIVQMIAG